MDQSRSGMSLAGPGIMFISAAIFGYFGFTSNFNYTGVNGEFLLFVALLDYTLKISAIAFFLTGVLTFVAPVAGNLFYSIVGLLSAVLFVVIAVLDIADTQHTAMHPFLLFLFAAWNGYGSWASLREIMAAKKTERFESAVGEDV